MARIEIPKQSLRWLVGRLHVGTPDSEVEADIRRRCSTATEAQRNACVKYALKCHAENRNLYSRVVSGRI